MKWILIILGIGIIAAAFYFLKKKEIEMDQRFQKRFSNKNIRFKDKYALFIAQKSDGYSHFRGTGYLVLTDQELFFERQVKRKVIEIPLNSITHVGETLRLAGKSTGRKKLKVEFKDQNGRIDAVAWRVKELQRWIDEISALINV